MIISQNIPYAGSYLKYVGMFFSFPVSVYFLNCFIQIAVVLTLLFPRDIYPR